MFVVQPMLENATKPTRKIVEKWLSLTHSVCVSSNTVDRYYVCSVYAWAYRTCCIQLCSGVARILKLPGHRNCMLLKAAHRGA